MVGEDDGTRVGKADGNRLTKKKYKKIQIMDPNLHPRGKGLHDMGTNPCASETSDLELSNAQGFESISLTVASEYSIENP